MGSKPINAFCMPGGGKLAFYAGILDPLPLGGNEVAVVTGQEMAHAPRVQDPYEAARRGG